MILPRSSKNLKQRYIVATVKSWYIRLFEQQITKSPGIWKLISKPEELYFETLNKFNPRFVFFIHWSNRVPKKIIDNFECICFHMTNLPYGRGGSPLQNLIIQGHKDTMISAIRMVEKIDAGPIYCQRPLSLLGNAEEIFIQAGKIIAEMIYELVEKEQQPIPQHGKIVKFKRRSSSESHIPIDADLEKAFDWIRMLDAEGYPPAFIERGNFKIEFKRAALRHNRIEADARITIITKEEADG
ncbi:Methionyl-tRNA formyltransferase [subsurface metagenome]